MTGSDDTNNENTNAEGTNEESQSQETTTQEVVAKATRREPTLLSEALASINGPAVRSDLPELHIGDTVKVHAKIKEGAKERIQVFEGIVLKRKKGNLPDATFTVRKISYNIGVERTFPLHSPRIDKIEIVSRAKVRRARLFYLRPLRGKSARMKTLYNTNTKKSQTPEQAA